MIMVQMTAKRALATLPAKASLRSDARFAHPDAAAELWYETSRAGSMVREGFRFERVRAFRFCAESHCTPWQVEDAFDTLVEVAESDWVHAILKRERTEMLGKWKIRHFLIFIDGSGAYEIAAESWAWLTDELGP